MSWLASLERMVSGLISRPTIEAAISSTVVSEVEISRMIFHLVKVTTRSQIEALHINR